MNKKSPEAPIRGKHGKHSCKRPMARSQKISLSIAAVGLAVAATFGGMAVYQGYFAFSGTQQAQEQISEQIQEQLEGGAYKGSVSGYTGLVLNGGYQGTVEGSAGVVPDTIVESSEGYGYIESPHWGRGNLVEGDVTSGKNTQALVNKGSIVHYQGQAQPGQMGNFAVSGHRTGTKEEPGIFKHAVDLKKGEIVKVTTVDGIFEYKVIRESKPVSVSVAKNMLRSDPLIYEKGYDPDSDDKKKSKYRLNTKRAFMTIQTCVGLSSYDREIIVLELVK